MARDVFDRPPGGFRHSTTSPGWVKRLPDPNAGKIKTLAEENAELKGALVDVMDRIAALEKKKSK
jgi:hypothetical protein